MAISYLVLVFVCFCTVSCSEIDNICHYNYNFNCSSQGKEDINEIKLCNIEHIPKEVNIQIMVDEKNSTSHGIIKVDFEAPNQNCKYKVSLFVNPYITNSEDCKKYQFNKDNEEEIHTLEKTICPRHESESEEKEDEVITTESSTCKDNVLSLWYQYIYTGCYALVFKLEKGHVVVGNHFLKTEYKKLEVIEPKLRCNYRTTFTENKSNTEMVSIAADISLLAGTSGLKLEVRPFSLLNKDDENFCHLESKIPAATVVLDMSWKNEIDIADNNCTLITTTTSSGDEVKNLECNFLLQTYPKDIGYCFFVVIFDVRCHRHTSWKPPINHIYPCSWKEVCKKIEEKSETNVVDMEKNMDPKINKIPRIVYLLLFVVIVLIVIAILSSIFIVYRKYSQQTKNTSRKLKTDFDDSNTVLELAARSQKEKLVKESGIVILYVRESDQFMNFMSEFKKILKQHTDCDIYDWWAPNSWNEVARIGGYEWVVKMIRKDCRVVWIDTLKARSLINMQHKNGYNNYKQMKNARGYNQEISDFRDSVYPAIVDFAKRNILYRTQEYHKHFVVRLGTFNNADKTEDPFAELSPNARYVIPTQLDKLCSELSTSELCFEDGMKNNKANLEKYLLEQSIVDL